VRVAHHEKQLFTLRKYLFQVEKYEKIEGCRIYQNVHYISVHAFSGFLKIFFSDSAEKTEPRRVVKSA